MISRLTKLIAPLNDVSTTFTHPPGFQKSTAQGIADFPDSHQALQKFFYPELAPLRVEKSAAQVFEVARELAQSMRGWDVVFVDLDRNHLEAVVTTPWLRFKDDVCVEVKALDDNHCEVQMRSKSRVGLSDLGANARRIHDFFDKLKKSLS